MKGFTPTLGLVPLFFYSLAPGSEYGDAFARSAEERIESKPNVRGDDQDWFFLVSELRHVAKGEFWTKPWEEVAINAIDPIPSLVEFQSLLAERGIRLLLVPVPSKASIYPERLDGNFASGDPYGFQPFLEQLRKKGLDVLNLERAFLEQRELKPDQKLYCAQDAHYSPSAIELVADMIVEHLQLESGQSPELKQGEAETISLTGDQIVHSEWEGKVPAEEVIVRKVMQGGEPGVEPDPGSPILLLGDSHTLVFQEGKQTGMHCKGAGLADQLSFRLGSAIDLVGGRGSGMVQSRKSLFFHATSHENYWETKQCVIWVFSVREFTESTDRPASIPLDR